MTTPPEGYHPDKNGDNCKVRIEGVWVTVAQLANLYHTAWIECLEWRCHSKNVAHAQDVHDAVRRGSGFDAAARREAGLDK